MADSFDVITQQLTFWLKRGKIIYEFGMILYSYIYLFALLSQSVVETLGWERFGNGGKLIKKGKYVENNVFAFPTDFPVCILFFFCSLSMKNIDLHVIECLRGKTARLIVVDNVNKCLNRLSLQDVLCVMFQWTTFQRSFG